LGADIAIKSLKGEVKMPYDVLPYQMYKVVLDALFNIILGISFLMISIGFLSTITTLRMHSEEKRKVAALLSSIIIFLGIILYIKAFFIDYPSTTKIGAEKIRSEKETIAEKETEK
jgi:cytochrome c biogenesis protein CcdA